MSSKYEIDETQRRGHKVFEAFAVSVVVPFSIVLATRKNLPKSMRVGAGLFGLGTLLVDGLLLASHHKND